MRAYFFFFFAAFFLAAMRCVTSSRHEIASRHRRVRRSYLPFFLAAFLAAFFFAMDRFTSFLLALSRA